MVLLGLIESLLFRAGGGKMILTFVGWIIMVIGAILALIGLTKGVGLTGLIWLGAALLVAHLGSRLSQSGNRIYR